MKHYDVIIIGTGAANIIADAAIRQHQRIAIIERRAWGGTCLNRGCIPTKVMVTAANRICEIHESRRIGVEAAAPRLNWDVLSRRVWSKIRTNSSIKAYYDQFPEVDTYNGTAAFTDKKTIVVTSADGVRTEMTGARIFIGTGACTHIPPIEGLEEAGYVTSETFFGPKFPVRPYRSLIIIGGGPIGCEFAHTFNAYGTAVTIVQHNVRLLPKEDTDVSAFILQQFQQRHIDVRLNQETLSVRREGTEKILTICNRSTAETAEVRAEEILVAPGIKPMTGLLHLEHTDVRLDRRGYIMTNEFLETSADCIWAIGDVNGLAPFRHKANYEAEILADNLFSNRPPEQWRWADYRTVPAVTYTYPETAHVGLTAKQASQQGYQAETAVNHYSAAVKGYALGYEPGDSDDGFVKLVINKENGHILGAHIVGPDASVLIQPFINALAWGHHVVQPIHEEIASQTSRYLRRLPLTRTLDPASVYTLSETMTPHPSLSEVTMWTRYYYEKK